MEWHIVKRWRREDTRKRKGTKISERRGTGNSIERNTEDIQAATELLVL